MSKICAFRLCRGALGIFSPEYKFSDTLSIRYDYFDEPDELKRANKDPKTILWLGFIFRSYKNTVCEFRGTRETSGKEVYENALEILLDRNHGTHSVTGGADVPSLFEDLCRIHDVIKEF